jgi:hypothetical protein
VSVGVLAVVYQSLVRRRILTWGTTVCEAASRLPGDELPEFQDPQVGEMIRLGANEMRLERVDPGEVLG